MLKISVRRLLKCGDCLSAETAADHGGKVDLFLLGFVYLPGIASTYQQIPVEKACLSNSLFGYTQTNMLM